MDADGSQRRFAAKRTVEQCIALSVSWMLQNNYLDLCVGLKRNHFFAWSNYCNEMPYTLAAELERVSISELRLYLRNTTQVVQLQPTDCNFGGVRWWFACPACERRCAKLYLRPSSAFQCRTCHDLTYQSCIEGKSRNAFLAAFAARHGWNSVLVKIALTHDTINRNKWRRKRDRRASYKGRG